MAIPEKQLATWANVGAVKAATDTYASIKTAIERAKSLEEYTYEVYLQGSYSNSTNVFGDMDVDVVVEATNFFYKDIADLTEGQKAEYKRRFPDPSDYTFDGVRAAVEKALIDYYGSSLVTLRKKCIQVTGKSGRLDADVVPCVFYRDYRKNDLAILPEPEEGITFFTRDTHRQVVNYPKQHYDKGVAKNRRTSDRFKPTVRIFKNLRNHCVANDFIGADTAPSYFVSCLIYNAPDVAFQKALDDTVLAVLQWMCDLSDEDWAKLVCQNELFYLCRDLPDLWKPAYAKNFCNAAIEAWNKWGK